MNRKRALRIGTLLAAAATVGGMAGAAMAGRDSGDSSMNPFTGDSYAYFHNGHNLGEQGTIFPNRVPQKAKVDDAKKTSAAPTTTSVARDKTDSRRSDAPDQAATR